MPLKSIISTGHKTGPLLPSSLACGSIQTKGKYSPQQLKLPKQACFLFETCASTITEERA